METDQELGTWNFAGRAQVHLPVEDRALIDEIDPMQVDNLDEIIFEPSAKRKISAISDLKTRFFHHPTATTQPFQPYDADHPPDNWDPHVNKTSNAPRLWPFPTIEETDEELDSRLQKFRTFSQLPEILRKPIYTAKELREAPWIKRRFFSPVYEWFDQKAAEDVFLDLLSAFEEEKTRRLQAEKAATQNYPLAQDTSISERILFRQKQTLAGESQKWTDANEIQAYPGKTIGQEYIDQITTQRRQSILELRTSELENERKRYEELEQTFKTWKENHPSNAATVKELQGRIGVLKLNNPQPSVEQALIERDEMRREKDLALAALDVERREIQSSPFVQALSKERDQLRLEVETLTIQRETAIFESRKADFARNDVLKENEKLKSSLSMAKFMQDRSQLQRGPSVDEEALLSTSNGNDSAKVIALQKLVRKKIEEVAHARRVAIDLEHTVDVLHHKLPLARKEGLRLAKLSKEELSELQSYERLSSFARSTSGLVSQKALREERDNLRVRVRVLENKLLHTNVPSSPNVWYNNYKDMQVHSNNYTNIIEHLECRVKFLELITQNRVFQVYVAELQQEARSLRPGEELAIPEPPESPITPPGQIIRKIFDKSSVDNSPKLLDDIFPRVPSHSPEAGDPLAPGADCAKRCRRMERDRDLHNSFSNALAERLQKAREEAGRHEQDLLLARLQTLRAENERDALQKDLESAQKEVKEATEEQQEGDRRFTTLERSRSLVERQLQSANDRLNNFRRAATAFAGTHLQVGVAITTTYDESFLANIIAGASAKRPAIENKEITKDISTLIHMLAPGRRRTGEDLRTPPNLPGVSRRSLLPSLMPREDESHRNGGADDQQDPPPPPPPPQLNRNDGTLGTALCRRRCQEYRANIDTLVTEVAASHLSMNRAIDEARSANIDLRQALSERDDAVKQRSNTLVQFNHIMRERDSAFDRLRAVEANQAAANEQSDGKQPDNTQSENQKVDDKNSNDKRENDKAIEKNDAVNIECQKRCQDYLGQIQNLRDEKWDLAKDLNTIRQQRDAAQQELDMAIQERDDNKVTQDDMQKIRSANDELQRQVSLHENALAQRVGEYNEALHIIELNRTTITDLENEITMLRDNIIQLELKRDQASPSSSRYEEGHLEGIIDNLELQMNQLQEHNKNLENENHIGQMTLDGVNHGYQQTRAELDSIGRALTETRRELEQARKDGSARDSEINMLERDRENLAEAFTVSSNALTSAGQDLDHANQNYRQAQKESNSLRDQLDKAESDNRRLLDEQHSLEGELNAVTDEVQRLSDDIDIHLGTIDRLTLERDQARQDASDANLERNSGHPGIYASPGSASSQQNTINRLTSQLDQLGRELNNVTRERDTARRERDSATTERENARAERDDVIYGLSDSVPHSPSSNNSRASTSHSQIPPETAQDRKVDDALRKLSLERDAEVDARGKAEGIVRPDEAPDFSTEQELMAFRINQAVLVRDQAAREMNWAIAARDKYMNLPDSDPIYSLALERYVARRKYRAVLAERSLEHEAQDQRPIKRELRMQKLRRMSERQEPVGEDETETARAARIKRRAIIQLNEERRNLALKLNVARRKIQEQYHEEESIRYELADANRRIGNLRAFIYGTSNPPVNPPDGRVNTEHLAEYQPFKAIRDANLQFQASAADIVAGLNQRNPGGEFALPMARTLSPGGDDSLPDFSSELSSITSPWSVRAEGPQGRQSSGDSNKRKSQSPAGIGNNTSPANSRRSQNLSSKAGSHSNHSSSDSNGGDVITMGADGTATFLSTNKRQKTDIAQQIGNGTNTAQDIPMEDVPIDTIEILQPGDIDPNDPCKEVKEELAKAKYELQVLAAQINSLQAQNAALQSTRQIDQNRNSGENGAQQSQDRLSDAVILQTRIAGLEQCISHREAANTRLLNQLYNLQIELRQEREKNPERSADNGQNDSQSSLQQELDRVCDLAKAYKEKVDELEVKVKNVSELEKKIEEQDKELGRQHETEQTLHDRITDIRNELQQAEENLQKTNVRLQKTLNERDEFIDEMRRRGGKTHTEGGLDLLQQAQQTIDECRQNIYKLTDKITVLRQTAEDKDWEIADRDRQIKAHVVKVADLQNRVDGGTRPEPAPPSNEQDNNYLYKQAQELKNANYDLRQVLEDKIKIAHNDATKLQNLRAFVDEQDIAIKGLKDKITSLVDEIQTNTSTIGTLETSVQQHKTEVENLQQLLRAEREQRDAASTAQLSTTSPITSPTTTKDSAAQTDADPCADIRADLATASAKVTSLRDSNAALLRVIDDRDKQIDDLRVPQGKIQRVEGRQRPSYNDASTSMHNDHNPSYKDASTSIDDDMLGNDDNDDPCAEIKADLEAARIKLNALQYEKNLLQEAVNKLEQDTLDKSEQIERLQRDNAAIQTHAKNSNQQTRDGSAESDQDPCAEIKDELQGARAQIAALQARLQALQYSVENRDEHILNLEAVEEDFRDRLMRVRDRDRASSISQDSQEGQQAGQEAQDRQDGQYGSEDLRNDLVAARSQVRLQQGNIITLEQNMRDQEDLISDLQENLKNVLQSLQREEEHAAAQRNDPCAEVRADLAAEQARSRDLQRQLEDLRRQGAANEAALNRLNALNREQNRILNEENDVVQLEDQGNLRATLEAFIDNVRDQFTMRDAVITGLQNQIQDLRNRLNGQGEVPRRNANAVRYLPAVQNRPLQWYKASQTPPRRGLRSQGAAVAVRSPNPELRLGDPVTPEQQKLPAIPTRQPRAPKRPAPGANEELRRELNLETPIRAKQLRGGRATAASKRAMDRGSPILNRRGEKFVIDVPSPFAQALFGQGKTQSDIIHVRGGVANEKLDDYGSDVKVGDTKMADNAGSSVAKGVGLKKVKDENDKKLGLNNAAVQPRHERNNGASQQPQENRIDIKREEIDTKSEDINIKLEDIGIKQEDTYRTRAATPARYSTPLRRASQTRRSTPAREESPVIQLTLGREPTQVPDRTPTAPSPTRSTRITAPRIAVIPSITDALVEALRGTPFPAGARNAVRYTPLAQPRPKFEPGADISEAGFGPSLGHGSGEGTLGLSLPVRTDDDKRKRDQDDDGSSSDNTPLAKRRRGLGISVVHQEDDLCDSLNDPTTSSSDSMPLAKRRNRLEKSVVNQEDDRYDSLNDPTTSLDDETDSLDDLPPAKRLRSSGKTAAKKVAKPEPKKRGRTPKKNTKIVKQKDVEIVEADVGTDKGNAEDGGGVCDPKLGLKDRLRKKATAKPAAKPAAKPVVNAATPKPRKGARPLKKYKVKVKDGNKGVKLNGEGDSPKKGLGKRTAKKGAAPIVNKRPIEESSSEEEAEPEAESSDSYLTESCEEHDEPDSDDGSGSSHGPSNDSEDSDPLMREYLKAQKEDEELDAEFMNSDEFLNQKGSSPQGSSNASIDSSDDPSFGYLETLVDLGDIVILANLADLARTPPASGKGFFYEQGFSPDTSSSSSDSDSSDDSSAADLEQIMDLDPAGIPPATQDDLFYAAGFSSESGEDSSLA